MADLKRFLLDFQEQPSLRSQPERQLLFSISIVLIRHWDIIIALIMSMNDNSNDHSEGEKPADIEILRYTAQRKIPTVGKPLIEIKYLYLALLIIPSTN